MHFKLNPPSNEVMYTLCAFFNNLNTSATVPGQVDTFLSRVRGPPGKKSAFNIVCWWRPLILNHGDIKSPNTLMCFLHWAANLTSCTVTYIMSWFGFLCGGSGASGDSSSLVSDISVIEEWLIWSEWLGWSGWSDPSEWSAADFPGRITIYNIQCKEAV